mgnify:CR=1 FL=1
MRPLSKSAIIRIADKCPVKKRIQKAVDGVMHQPITDARFMNMPTLGVIDIKTFVAAVRISLVGQISMEC